eukprot:6106927-Pyramimonas_sp.AAC.1
MVQGLQSWDGPSHCPVPGQGALGRGRSQEPHELMSGNIRWSAGGGPLANIPSHPKWAPLRGLIG